LLNDADMIIGPRPAFSIAAREPGASNFATLACSRSSSAGATLIARHSPASTGALRLYFPAALWWIF